MATSTITSEKIPFDLWNFIMDSEGPIKTVSEVESFIKEYPKSCNDSLINDLIDESYYSKKVSDEVAVFLFDYGIKVFDIKPYWFMCANQKKSCHGIRMYAFYMLAQGVEGVKGVEYTKNAIKNWQLDNPFGIEWDQMMINITKRWSLWEAKLKT